MKETPDIEVIFKFNGTRTRNIHDGYRPAHLVKDDYLTTGVHHYYGTDVIGPSDTVRGTITFITPEYYPHTMWIGKEIRIQEGPKVIGYATVTKIFNELLMR